MAAQPFGLSIPGLAIPEHNYVSLTYTSSQITGVVYRAGGASGNVVASLSLTYDGNGNLLTITKS
jgi:hypothetical protein